MSSPLTSNALGETLLPTQTKRFNGAGAVGVVIDGDSFVTQRGRRVRLNEVDAPEIGQTGYIEATKYLLDLIGGRKVTIKEIATDAYGRTIADVSIGDLSVNLSMKLFLMAEGYSRK